MRKHINIPEDRKSYFSSPPPLCDSLYQIGEKITVPANHVLVREGEIPAYCYIILSGRIMSIEVHLNGNEQIYIINEKNSMILEGHLIYRIPSEINFVAPIKTELLRISRNDLISAIDTDPDVAFSVIGSVTQKFLSSMKTIRQSRNFNTAWKVCNLLLIFAGQYGKPVKGMIMIKEKISQQLIANLLGVNRVTVVNIMQDLKDMDLVVQMNGYYCIVDMDALTAYRDEVEK